VNIQLGNTIKRRAKYSVVIAGLIAFLPFVVVLTLEPASDSFLGVSAGLLMCPGQPLASYLFHLGVHDGVFFLAVGLLLNWLLFTPLIIVGWSLLGPVMKRFANAIRVLV
jgi:hypothetical protein